MSQNQPTLLFLVTEDWYFCSHRLPLARAARAAGFHVVVATRVHQHGESIRREGFELIPIGLRRRGRNPAREVASIVELVQLYRQVRPTIVHHVAMKPVLYGSLAARIAGVHGVVNALAGMGYIFTSTDRRARLLRPLVVLGFRASLGGRHSRLIVQNVDDRDVMVRSGFIRPDRIRLVRGSGVDLERFAPTAPPPGPVRITMVSRMLRDKGVLEFVDAAKRIRARGGSMKFVLVGGPDEANPASIAVSDLRRWTAEGVVEWVGHRDDIAAEWQRSHIAVLPSYREGLPKALLEAAACGLPLVTTDVPGCRELVHHDDNGFLVPPRDAAALAAAIERLADSPELRTRLGARARERVEQEFAESIVAAQTVAIYRELYEVVGPAATDPR